MKTPKKKQRGSTAAVLRAISRRIQAAMKERGLDATELTEALGLEAGQRGTVANWVMGRNGPGLAFRAKLAEVLGVPEEQLTLDRATHQNKAMGPARRAVALATATRAQANGEIIVMPPTPAVSDVLTIRARSDGTMHVRLDASLPYAKGGDLVKYLLEFGLVVKDEPGENEP